MVKQPPALFFYNQLLAQNLAGHIFGQTAPQFNLAGYFIFHQPLAAEFDNLFRRQLGFIMKDYESFYYFPEMFFRDPDTGRLGNLGVFKNCIFNFPGEDLVPGVVDYVFLRSTI